MLDLLYYDTARLFAFYYLGIRLLEIIIIVSGDVRNAFGSSGRSTSTGLWSGTSLTASNHSVASCLHLVVNVFVHLLMSGEPLFIAFDVAFFDSSLFCFLFSHALILTPWAVCIVMF